MAVLDGLAAAEERDQLARLALERALRPGADRPPVGRPFGPRRVRQRAGRRLRRARRRHRTVAGEVSRRRPSRGDRWPPREAGGRRRRSPVSLRDGSEGVVLFPPAAPAGPVLTLRRGEPGEATLERLVAAGRLDRRMADLLRIATRSRLNMLVVGPERAGKTALLAALARDLGDARVVTLARHRAVPLGSRREGRVDRLAAGALGHAAGRPAFACGPTCWLSIRCSRPTRRRLATCLSAGARGIVAAGEPQAMAGVPRQSVDLVVRVGRLRRIVRRDLHRGCDRRPALRLSERRRVSSTDEPRRHSPGPCTRQATARRFPACCASGAYPPVRPAATYRSGLENPLRHRPISGTNRFELRGILRVGTLQRERPAEGTIA